MTTRTLRLLRAALLGALVIGGRATAAPLLADLQVSTPQPEQYVLHLRSTAAQAFDVRAGGTARRVEVDLHGARRASTLPALSRQPFGRIKLANRPHDGVRVRLRLRRGFTAAVRQGASPSTVEIRIGR